MYAIRRVLIKTHYTSYVEYKLISLLLLVGSYEACLVAFTIIVVIVMITCQRLKLYFNKLNSKS